MFRSLSFAAVAVMAFSNSAYAVGQVADAASDASNVKVHSDSKGMPHCLNVPHSDAGVILTWKNSSGYGRDVKAIELSQASNLWSVDGTGENCNGYEQLLEQRDAGGSSEGAIYVTVTEDMTSVFGVPLSADVRAAIAELRLGSDVYHPETAGAEYLRNHPIDDYTRQVNRDLTRKFGQGFSGQIYKAWVESKPENADFKARVLKHVTELESGRSMAQQTAAKLRGYTLVMAPGFMQPISQGRAADMLTDLAQVGINVTVLNVSQMGSIDSNIELIESQLRPMLLSGKKLIVLGLSKGLPEIMTASTRLMQDSEIKASSGRVAGVLSLSGMFDGAFVVDWTKTLPQSIAAGLVLKKVLYKEAKTMNITDMTLDGFKSMASKSIESYTQENLQNLPANIPVACVIGVIGGDGTAKDESISTLQNQFVKPYLSRSGGNDGYVEYPGTCLPRSQRGNNVSEIVFDASHVFLDGTFMGRDLSQSPGRRNTVVSVLDVLLSQIK